MKNLTKGFAPIIIVVIVAVLAVGGGTYAVKKSDKGKSSQTATSTNSSGKSKAPEISVKSAGKSASDPKKVYLDMRAEFDKAQTFSDIFALTMKFGSAKTVQESKAQKAQIDALNPEFRDALVAQMKLLMPSLSEITNIAVTTNGNNATLKISTSKSDVSGTVLMVLENGVWKLDSESWESSSN